jgi:8-oxo-dGTP pyrophosphatase MutT (NUDIX family)
VNETIRDIRQMFDAYQRVEIRDPGLQRAAVLIPLFPQGGTLHLLLTQRTETVEHHKGQISFPGGAMDPEDGSVITTALRETEEEIGLGRTQVDVLGVLNDLATPTGFSLSRSIPPRSPP